MDGCCVVCAEPLEWTAYGSCGHMDTCSKCVVRLRQVLEDKRCVICQQQSQAVYVTRYMGDYTTRLQHESFNNLLDRAKSSELFHLNQINAFFDDEEHYRNIKAVSSITHPILEDVLDVPHFKSIGSLRRFIQDKCGKHLCSICLEGRKVFVSEQILYDKAGLNRHMRQGESDGPLGVAGFKGHPLCKFCTRRFYSDNELYLHNQQSHETCFVCRRNNPDRHLYFRNYEELDGHFREKHYPCPHPSCLEKKFVVYATEAELNQHFSREHKENSGGQSRAQLREALALQTNFQLRRTGQGEGEEATTADNRAGIVIGGGGNVHSRVRRGQGRGAAQDTRDSQGLTHSRGRNETVPYDNYFQLSQVQNYSAAQSGRDHEDARPAQQPDLTGADFPTLQGGSTAAGSSNGNWAGRGGSHQGPSIHSEDFPSLPSEEQKGKGKKTQSKSSSRGAWGQAAVAPRRAQWAAPAQVAKKNSKPADSSRAKTASSSHSRASAAGGSSQQLSEQLPPGPPWVDLKGKSHAPLSQPKRQSLPPELLSNAPSGSGPKETNLGARDFPSLASSPQPTQQPQWQAKVKKSKVKEAKPPPKPPVSTKEDFPTLSSQPRQYQTMSQDGPSQPQSGIADITQELKATTKSLANMIKAQIPCPDYSTLKDAALSFCEGRMPADDYHDLIVDLGIVQYAGDLAAVCPVILRGLELFEVHRRFVKLASQSSACAPADVPLEVLVVGIENLEREGLAWYCSSCKVVNSAQADFCEICDRGKPRVKLSEIAGLSHARPGSRSNSKTRKFAGPSSTGYRKKEGQQLFGSKVVRKVGNSPWGGGRK